MACGLFGALSLLKPTLTCCRPDHKEQISMKFSSNTAMFIQEYKLWNVAGKMVANLSRSENANSLRQRDAYMRQ